MPMYPAPRRVPFGGVPLGGVAGAVGSQGASLVVEVGRGAPGGARRRGAWGGVVRTSARACAERGIRGVQGEPA